MKKTLVLFTIYALLLPVAGCSENGKLYDELPGPIASFVTEYFEGYSVSTYYPTKEGYQVILKYGPGITFDKDYSWTSVNGYGMPLPQVFVYDEFPDKLYDYIESMENTANVYRVNRTGFSYIVILLDSALSYDISTGTVHQIPVPEE